MVCEINHFLQNASTVFGWLRKMMIDHNLSNAHILGSNILHPSV